MFEVQIVILGYSSSLLHPNTINYLCHGDLRDLRVVPPALDMDVISARVTCLYGQFWPDTAGQNH